MSYYFKWVLALCVVWFSIGNLFAQKIILDTSSLGRWPLLREPLISNDGRYAAYNLFDPHSITNSVVIQNVKKGWKKIYKNADDVHFSMDNSKAFLRVKDSLHILDLEKSRFEQIIASTSYSHPRIAAGEWVSYQPTNQKEDLIILNILTSKEKRYQFVKRHIWEDNGKALVLFKQYDNKTSLTWIDLPSLKEQEIWTQTNSVSQNSLPSVVFNHFGTALAFTSTENSSISVWYYQQGTERAKKLVTDNSDVTSTLKIRNYIQFSQNDHWIFLQLEKQVSERMKPRLDAANVDVYSYHDQYLQSRQLNELNSTAHFDAVISLSGGSIVQLENDVDGESNLETPPSSITGDYAVISEKLHKNFDPNWLAGYNSSSYFLVSLMDGSRMPLKPYSKFFVSDLLFTPDGKKVIYWDSEVGEFKKYDLTNGKRTNLTKGIPHIAKEDDYVNMFGDSNSKQPFGHAAFADNGNSILFYSQFDIWKVDLNDNLLPLNLTNGYGAKHHLLFRLANESDKYGNTIIYGKGQSILLTAFNEKNKQNGFYGLNLDKLCAPKLLTMGAYSYYKSGSQLPSPRIGLSHELKPIKANGADAWIVSRETATDYPNYFYTTDWKNFTALTELHPQKEYNWLTAELINYKQNDGTSSQGILYKPENFDPKKNYPVIINYYEHLSYRLHEFPMPEYTSNNINIPWFISHGYLIFTPDSHYTIASRKGGKTFGEAALNSIGGAAKYLAKLPYVDKRHIGIQGHSFGGGETNYLVTHCHLFAAACSASGTVSDQVSAYLGPYRRKGYEPQYYRLAHSETGHEMIGATLWQRPDLYFRSSSIFNADKVTTPLLLMHNEADSQTDWGQSFELFAALTRLSKPVWMLQYDNEGHSLERLEDKKDFTIRLTQFFDCFLKGLPAPKWMISGIPAKLKGIDQGYELEPGKKP